MVPPKFSGSWGTYLGYIGMCGLKVSRAWFFTRFGHDWPFWSKKGMLLHSSVKVGRKNHSFCFQYGKGFGKWAAHST